MTATVAVSVNELTIVEIKKLLHLTRREISHQEHNVWPLFQEEPMLKSIERKLLYEYNTRPI